MLRHFPRCSGIHEAPRSGIEQGIDEAMPSNSRWREMLRHFPRRSGRRLGATKRCGAEFQQGIDRAMPIRLEGNALSFPPLFRAPPGRDEAPRGGISTGH